MSAVICERVFPGRPDQVRQARRWIFAAASILCDGTADDAALVTSELVTNALRHSASGAPGGKFAVAVQAAAGALVIHVRDQGSPASGCGGNGTGPAGGDGHGNGLAIVAGLSAAWGIEPATACSCGDPADPAAAGRCTWSRLTQPQQASGGGQ